MPPKLPKFISFKTATPPSALSRLLPHALTPAQKLSLSRARIWGTIIGGNLRSGLKHLRSPLKGAARLSYFDYAYDRFYMPCAPPPKNDTSQIKELRELRESRKGKPEVTAPRLKKEHVPKHELKRFLLMEQRRKERGGQ